MKTDKDNSGQTENFHSDVLHAIRADIAVLDAEGHYLFVNNVAVKDPQLRQWMIGRTDREYCVRNGLDLRLAAKRKSMFCRLLENKQEVEWEEKLVNEDGEAAIYLRKLSPVQDDQGNIKMVIAYGLNIT